MIRILVETTGLPEETVQKEVDKILESSGVSEDSLTLEDLREAMMRYLDSLEEQLSQQPGEVSEPLPSKITH